MHPPIIIPVAPLVPLPLNKTAEFSYAYGRPVPVGSLVSIPLANRMVRGIVTAAPQKTAPRFKLKSIRDVLEESVITPRQMRFARWLSQEYYTPFGIVLGSFVCKQVRSASKNKPSATPIRPLELTLSQREARDKILAAPDRTFFLYGPSGSGKTEVSLDVMRHIAENGKQALILVPELTLVPQIFERARMRMDEKGIAVLHGKLADGEFRAQWQRIRSGEASIVIGTRTALFAPFANLGIIVMDEEQDISYKQWDMAPRYDARVASRALIDIHPDAKLLFVGATPSVERLYDKERGVISFLEIPRLQLPNSDARLALQRSVSIVNMRLETWQSKQTSRSSKPLILSDTLVQAVRDSVRRGSQSILLVNRQGMSRITLCASCRNALACPDCDRLLTYRPQGDYACPGCPLREDGFPRCRRCGSIEWVNVGFGTQKVEETLRKLFPSCRIARADSSSMRRVHAQEELFHDFSSGKIDILVGTQMISKGWDIPALDVVGIVSADDMLRLPDYDADERAFQTLMQAIGRVGRIGSTGNGKVIIQTYRPEHRVFSTLSDTTTLTFLREELETRRDLRYPPFSRFMKIFGSGENEDRLRKESEKIVRSIRESAIPGVTVRPPSDSPFEKLRADYRCHLLVRIIGEYREIETALRDSILSSLPRGWTVDLDPLSLNERYGRRDS